MGINKTVRKQIEGHRRMIAQHQQKIEAEMAKRNPEDELIDLWKKQIANATSQIEKLERRRRQRRR